MANKNILLIEPSYNNKYPPLGLMKIASYHGPDGKKDNITWDHMPSKYWNYNNLIGLHELIETQGKHFW